MTLDARVKKFLNRLNAGPKLPIAEMTVAARRNALAELLVMGATPADHLASWDDVIPSESGSLAVRIYSSNDAISENEPTILYVHGGGLVAGDLDTHGGIAKALAMNTGYPVVSLSYRLAPEHPFPAALQDVSSAVQYLARRSGQSAASQRTIVVVGDSAGATLVAATSHMLRNEGPHPVALQVLLCPILDYTSSTGSRQELERGYFLEKETLDHDLKYYLTSKIDRADPRVSPGLESSLCGVPATIIHTAEYDPLRDEGYHYYTRLKAAEVEVTYRCHPGMIHLFYALGGFIPYASDAIAMLSSDIVNAVMAKNAAQQ